MSARAGARAPVAVPCWIYSMLFFVREGPTIGADLDHGALPVRRDVGFVGNDFALLGDGFDFPDLAAACHVRVLLCGFGLYPFPWVTASTAPHWAHEH